MKANYRSLEVYADGLMRMPLYVTGVAINDNRFILVATPTERGGRIDIAVLCPDGEFRVLDEEDIDNLPIQCRKALQKELENDVLLELLPINTVTELL